VRKLVVVEFVTLDGVMQGLGGPDEDRDGGFEHGGWGQRYADETQMAASAEQLPSTTAYLFGRKTFEKMAAFWPFQPDENPMAAHLNATPKYVATHGSPLPDWAGSHVLAGDLAEAVAGLKAEGDGNVVVLGSGELVQQLIAHDLVDEYRLFLHPLVLGTGKRLFRTTEHPLPLRLLRAVPTPTGVVMLTYATA
jgi:dihydrofolate reductase